MSNDTKKILNDLKAFVYEKREEARKYNDEDSVMLLNEILEKIEELEKAEVTSKNKENEYCNECDKLDRDRGYCDRYGKSLVFIKDDDDHGRYIRLWVCVEADKSNI